MIYTSPIKHDLVLDHRRTGLTWAVRSRGAWGMVPSDIAITFPFSCGCWTRSPPRRGEVERAQAGIVTAVLGRSVPCVVGAARAYRDRVDSGLPHWLGW